MSLHQIKKRTDGFTIIEVLIVLAIAGLIMLIVFLAVPALQRNSRNTQRKSDISNLLGAVAEYSSNNNGKIPTKSDGSLITANTKLSFYDPAQVTVKCLTSVSTTIGSDACTGATYAATDITDNNVIVYFGAKCVSNAPASAGASTRNLVVMNKTEGSTASTLTCTES